MNHWEHEWTAVTPGHRPKLMNESITESQNIDKNIDNGRIWVTQPIASANAVLLSKQEILPTAKPTPYNSVSIRDLIVIIGISRWFANINKLTAARDIDERSWIRARCKCSHWYTESSITHQYTKHQNTSSPYDHSSFRNHVSNHDAEDELKHTTRSIIEPSGSSSTRRTRQRKRTDNDPPDPSGGSDARHARGGDKEVTAVTQTLHVL